MPTVAQSWEYTFNATTFEPPGNNQLRFDAGAPYDAVTRVWFRKQTADAKDIHTQALRIAVGATVYLQDRNEAARYVVFETIAAPIEKLDYMELPVRLFEASSLPLLAPQTIDLQTAITFGLPSVVGNGTAGTLAQWTGPAELANADATTGSAYVALPAAKAHLRISDDDHDGDIQSKLNQAESIILELVASGRTRRVEPAPPAPGTSGGLILQSAILELLAGLYEHRGDDFGVNQPDEELWNAIRRKVARLRDPALA